MSRQRFALLLIAALVVISGAMYLSAQRSASRSPEGVALLPSLAKDLNAVTAVIVRKGSATPTLTVHITGNQWTVAERADFPADVTKVRKLLLALRDAKIVEEKTSDPARFASIGVEDPVASDAAGAEITVVGPGEKHAVIVGKSVGEGNFVRRAGENRSYSIEPAISFETDPHYWIDSRLLDVPAAQIQSIEVKPAAGVAYAIRRAKPADGAKSADDTKPADDTFSLDGVPAGRKALDGHALAPSPTTLTNLTAEDVAPSSGIDFAASTQEILTLTDGNVITLTGAAVAGKHWIEVKSSKDAALTAKTAGRAFEIASYRYDAIFKPVEQLLVPKEQPAAKGSPAPKGSPATSRTTGSPAPKGSPATSGSASPSAAPAHGSKKPLPANEPVPAAAP